MSGNCRWFWLPKIWRDKDDGVSNISFGYWSFWWTPSKKRRMMGMTVQAAKCDICGDTVYPRVPIECRSCSCGNLMVNGWGDKFVAVFDHAVGAPSSLLVDATELDLYKDWRDDLGKYGIIQGRPNSRWKGIYKKDNK